MDIRKEQHMKKIDLIENQKYNLEDVELEDVAGGAFPRLPIEKKNNRCCPKCGKFLQVAVCNYVEGRGLELVVSCFDCGIHWISQEFDRNDDIEYIFVDGKFEDNARWHVIPKSF